MLLSACLLCAPASPQIPNLDHYLPSPNMASLGEYGSVPVSLFTGIQSVDVPLYTLQSRGHAFPVSLSYHGGGVKVDSHPGWVGLGWTLVAGGSVTRVVNDLPDESDCYNMEDINVMQYSMTRKMGVFHNRNYQGLYNSFDPFSFVQYAPVEGRFDIFPESEDALARRQYCRYDTEPDLFRFDLPGLSGYFYFTGGGAHPGEGAWRVVCDRPVKVLFDIDDPDNFRRPFSQVSAGERFFKMRSESINNFRLVDEQGTVYTFGSTDPADHSAVEYSVGFFSQESEELAAVAWHLTSVRYTDGTEVRLKYGKKDYIAQFSVSENYTEQLFDHEVHYFRYNGQPVSTQVGQMSVTPYYGFAQGSLLVPAYLKEIEMGETRLVFETAESRELPYDPELYYDMHNCGCEKADKNDMPYLQRATVLEKAAYHPGFECFGQLRWHKLTRISVKDRLGNLLRSFDFGYNDDDPSRSGKERLALLSLTEISADGNSVGAKHTFEYDRLDRLPPYCTYDVDHWGFYKRTGIARIDTADNGDRRFTRIIRPFDVKNENNSWASEELLPFDPTLRADPFAAPRRVSTNPDRDDRTSYERARDADPSLASIGSLVRVNYPAGGYTRFEYENHEYRASVDTIRTRLLRHSGPRTAGGLRLKNIYRSADGQSETLYRSYRYADAHDPLLAECSGILMHPRQYYAVLFNDNVSDDHFDLKSAVTKVFNTQSVYPRSADGDGAEVCYSAVTEIFPDGSSTVHRFTNHDDGHKDEILDNFPRGGLSVYFPYVSKAMERGLLKSRVHYDADGVPVQADSLFYEPDDLRWRAITDGLPSQLYMARIFNHCVTIELPWSYIHTQADVNVKEVFPRRVYTYRMRPVGRTVTDYKDGVPVAVTRESTSYTSLYSLPREVVTTYADMSYDKSETRYLFDDYGPDPSAAANALTDAFVLDRPVMQTLSSFTSGSPEGEETKLRRTYMSYSASCPSAPVAVSVRNGVEAPPDSVTMTYIYGDRPVCQKNVNTGLSTVYVWGCGGEHVVAKVLNADLDAVEAHIGSLAQFAKASAPDYSKLRSLSASLPDAQVTMYVYKLGVGVVEQTAPDGTVVHYHYDEFGRLAYTTDQNSDIIEIYDYNYSGPKTSFTP